MVVVVRDQVEDGRLDTRASDLISEIQFASIPVDSRPSQSLISQQATSLPCRARMYRKPLSEIEDFRLAACQEHIVSCIRHASTNPGSAQPFVGPWNTSPVCIVPSEGVAIVTLPLCRVRMWSLC
jgi:hypothetical protein